VKKLVIAEKPSVARDLARVLGNIPKKDDFFENDEWVIDCAVGHLVELFMPDDFDKKLKGWKIANLPIIPSEFQLKPVSATKKKFQQLKKQLKRKDVELVINACDAGREGELIFTYIYELAKATKPVKRLWMLSMTDQSIKNAFANLRDGEAVGKFPQSVEYRPPPFPWSLKERRKSEISWQEPTLESLQVLNLLKEATMDFTKGRTSRRARETSMIGSIDCGTRKKLNGFSSKSNNPLRQELRRRRNARLKVLGASTT